MGAPLPPPRGSVHIPVRVSCRLRQFLLLFALGTLLVGLPSSADQTTDKPADTPTEQPQPGPGVRQFSSGGNPVINMWEIGGGYIPIEIDLTEHYTNRDDTRASLPSNTTVSVGVSLSGNQVQLCGGDKTCGDSASTAANHFDGANTTPPTGTHNGGQLNDTDLDFWIKPHPQRTATTPLADFTVTIQTGTQTFLFEVQPTSIGFYGTQSLTPQKGSTSNWIIQWTNPTSYKRRLVQTNAGLRIPAVASITAQPLETSTRPAFRIETSTSSDFTSPTTTNIDSASTDIETFDDDQHIYTLTNPTIPTNNEIYARVSYQITRDSTTQRVTSRTLRAFPSGQITQISRVKDIYHNGLEGTHTGRLGTPQDEPDKIEIAWQDPYTDTTDQNPSIDRWQYRIGYNETQQQTQWGTDVRKHNTTNLQLKTKIHNMRWINLCPDQITTKNIDGTDHLTYTIWSHVPNPSTTQTSNENCGHNENHDELTKGQPIRIQLRGIDDQNTPNPHVTYLVGTQTLTLPPVPDRYTNLFFRALQTSIEIRWATPTLNKGQTDITDSEYRYRLADQNTWITDWTNTTSNTSHTITGLTETTEYCVELRNRNTAGWGYIFNRCGLTQGPPKKPIGLKAIPGIGSVTLTWTRIPTAKTLSNVQQSHKPANAPDDQWTPFYERGNPRTICPNSGHGTTAAGGQGTCRITGLTQGQTYQFRIRGTSTQGNGEPSDIVEATTLTGTTPITPNPTAGGAPPGPTGEPGNSPGNGNGTTTSTFTDTSESVHQTNIGQLAQTGVTRGCNPPTNDRFCPNRAVTRAEMATFLTRAFNLATTSQNPFTDTTNNIHTNNINNLAAADISQGCNPPQNTRYCPDRAVTRAEMATFLTRTLQLQEEGTGFTDTQGNVHATNIARFANAGITRGCNPPQNTRYCPNRAVTRAEMATFLVRSTALNNG